MTDLYLIAHKVRGARAFDIAAPMECPLCDGGADPMCIECNEMGYWWIVPTSGHRAYPFWGRKLGDLFEYESVGQPPDNLPDHYIYKPLASRAAVSSGEAVSPRLEDI